MNEMTKPPVAKPAARSSEAAPMRWLRNEIDHLFEDFGQASRGIFNFASPAMCDPALDLADTGGAYRLTAELPGMTDQEIKVDVADGVLTIAGEKSEDSEKKEGGYLISERRYGTFSRQVVLPTDADSNAIMAKFERGLLTVTIDKDKAAPPRKKSIAIKA